MGLWETGEDFFFVRLCTLLAIPAVDDESDGNIKYPLPYWFVPVDISFSHSQLLNSAISIVCIMRNVDFGSLLCSLYIFMKAGNYSLPIP